MKHISKLEGVQGEGQPSSKLEPFKGPRFREKDRKRYLKLIENDILKG